MTWQQLADVIKSMGNAQRQSDVTVMVNDEFYLAELKMSDDTYDVLDIGHPYIIQKEYWPPIHHSKGVKSMNENQTQTLTGYVAPMVPFDGPAFTVFIEACKTMQAECKLDDRSHWRDHVAQALLQVVARINSELSEPLSEWAVDRIHEDAINLVYNLWSYSEKVGRSSSHE